MKKLLSTLFLLFFTIIFSQEYQFDYMLKSTVKRENPDYNYQSYDMVNSKNHSYYMEVSKNTITQNYYSIIIDKKRKLVNRFFVSDINKIPINFKFESKNNLSGHQFYKYSNLKIENIGELKYKISPERILKPKKQILEIEIELEKSEDDLVIINFEPLLREQEYEIENLIKEKLKSENQNGNFYIKEIKIKYFKNSFISEKIELEKVKVQLNITD